MNGLPFNVSSMKTRREDVKHSSNIQMGAHTIMHKNAEGGVRKWADNI